MFVSLFEGSATGEKGNSDVHVLCTKRGYFGGGGGTPSSSLTSLWPLVTRSCGAAADVPLTLDSPTTLGFSDCILLCWSRAGAFSVGSSTPPAFSSDAGESTCLVPGGGSLNPLHRAYSPLSSATGVGCFWNSLAANAFSMYFV